MSPAPEARVIGRSVLGRPIEALVFAAAGGAASGAHALVHAGIHGDEPGAVEAVQRLAERLRGRGEGPRLVLVPAVNPDGLAAGRKDNARGVDLNRNFPSTTFAQPDPLGHAPGPAPLCEPESRALAELMEAERPRQVVAVHQPFRCVNYDGPARPLAEAMAAACGWPVIEELGYATPGSFGSRYGRDLGLPVITLELPRPLDAASLEAAVAALLVACR